MFRLFRSLVTAAVLVGLAAGCNLPGQPETASPPPQPTLTHTAVQPTSTTAPTQTTPPTAAQPIPPTPTATTAPTPAATCLITALADTDAYVLPYTSARKFGTLSSGEKITILGRTADNWFGFDPGVAQAGNVGIFRNRWVKESGSLSISPDCYNLATVYTRIPLPGVCYAMIMAVTPVHAAPSSTSTASAVLNIGDWAAALGVSGSWLKIDLGNSSTAQTGYGWISQDVVGFNGCEAPLPAVVP